MKTSLWYETKEKNGQKNIINFQIQIPPNPNKNLVSALDTLAC